jgi:glucosamine--fructose-6-phosphate aminotransferase (isomerizing)
MCGIFGYVGPGKATDIVLNGLKKLEYRGYDSAGIAGLNNGKLISCKEVGKLSVLEAEVRSIKLELNTVIGHTRWATHGIPNKINSHPHLDEKQTLALVHNGTIENHEVLRKKLKGTKFISDTDSEVIAHLIASLYEGDILKAVQKAVPLLEGNFAVALIHKDYPNQIITFANQLPLVIGVGDNEAFVASDSHAFAAHTREVIFLSNGEIAVVKPNKLEVFNSSMESIQKSKEKLKFAVEDLSKGDYEHFTLKEIFQQPQTIRSALGNRFLQEYGSVTFEDVRFDLNELLAVERILILGCGTSFHAGLIGAAMLEDRARIPVEVDISSEFRYKNPIVPHGTFVIAISQSGETADTLAAVREVKAKGAKVLAICNVQGSSLVRESDATLFLHAGPEIGVCSTKAFTSQVTVLALLTVLMARMRHMSKQEGQEFLTALQQLPDQVQAVLNLSGHIEKIAKKYAKFDNFFFMGRRYMFPTSLEGALKLKEISYINANGYPAGEIKHGPISLLNESCPVVALCANKSTLIKLQSNLEEAKARKAPVIAIAEEGLNKVEGIADDIIWVPQTIDELAAIPTTIATQLLAYYIARERGADIDQPRNLAKSVTVE